MKKCSASDGTASAAARSIEGLHMFEIGSPPRGVDVVRSRDVVSRGFGGVEC
jgi:hypothetical protein